MQKTILIAVTALLGATLSASAAVLLADSRTTTNPTDDGFATPDVIAAGFSSIQVTDYLFERFLPRAFGQETGKLYH